MKWISFHSSLAYAILVVHTASFPQLVAGTPFIAKNALKSWLQKRGDDGNATSEAVRYIRIDVSGEHAWRPPGANDKYVVSNVEEDLTDTNYWADEGRVLL